MPYKILLAGAGGAIGRRLTPLLRNAGHEVFGTTRSAAKAQELKAAGVEPVVVDVFDAAGLSRLVAAIRPEIVIHQLTDLPDGFGNLDPSQRAQALSANARIRVEGTRNLVAATLAAGARRLIAQSIAWVYAPGREPHTEGDALDLNAEGSRGVTIDGVAALEKATLHSPPLEGIVLRYGQFYGPGTGADQPSKTVPPLHVDAAAVAALLAIDRGRPGIFNVAEANNHVATDKARSELGWDPAFRLKG